MFGPDGISSMYHSFQFPPSTSNNETATSLRLQTDQHQSRGHITDERLTPPNPQHTLRPLPHFVAERERATSVAPSQQTQGPHQPLPPSMDNLYMFDIQNEHSNDEEDLSGFEN